mgnify:FL=1
MTNDEIIAILQDHPELIPDVLAILTKRRAKTSPSDVA